MQRPSSPSPIPPRRHVHSPDIDTLDMPSSVRTLTHLNCDIPADPTPNQATSGSEPEFLWFPESPPLPSPPDSPYSSASVSSFPSVGSSFFFSSAAASPPHPPTDSGSATAGLVIPSLTLPDALRRPTAYGRTMGEVRLIVVGKGTKKVVGEMLDMDDSEDVVDVGRWEGDVIRASTDWIEHLDAHGLEKYEALKNVEVRVIEVLDDEEDDIIQDHITTLKETIQQPFQVISDVLHPEGQPSAVLANLLSSSSTPLYTALILLVDNPPTIQQTTLLTSLSPVIPIIPFSTSRRLPPTLSLPGTSPFHPDNTHALQRLFRPDTLNLLRSEAADKFLKWREVHRTVAQIERQSQSSNTSTKIEVDEGEEKGWDKQKWELEYLHTLSLDVARMRARSSTITPSHSSFTNHSSCLPSSSSVSAPPGTALGPIDPLHLPSLILFSLSLLGPLKHSVIRMFREAVGVLGDGRVRAALVSGVVVGFGVGLGVGR